MFAVVDDLDGERVCLGDIGEVDVRLRERGCMGVMGTELDRWSVLFVADLTRSSSSAGRWGGVAGSVGAEVGFAASPSALSVALTTWVASAALSRTDKPLSAAGVAVLARFDGALATVFAPVFALDLAWFAAFEPARALLSLAIDVSSFESSRVLSKAEVAAEHVATDETALRTASAWASGVSMKKVLNGLIPNHIIAVSRTLSKRTAIPGVLMRNGAQWNC
jgi:hypothetical protein